MVISIILSTLIDKWLSGAIISVMVEKSSNAGLGIGEILKSVRGVFSSEESKTIILKDEVGDSFAKVDERQRIVTLSSAYGRSHSNNPMLEKLIIALSEAGYQVKLN